MNWLVRNWWLIFPAWIVFACIAGPLIGRYLKYCERVALERAFHGPSGEHPRTCGCRSCFEKGLRSGGVL